jgi:hypothetical protein
MRRRSFLEGVLGCGAANALRAQAAGVEFNSLLPPTEGNPRNTEGDFVKLRDGRILFAYTRFTGDGGDHGAAGISARFSSDGGRTWTDRDEVLLANEGQMNVMSVSLLRLKDGRIAFFYLKKDSVTECTPHVRYSKDEGRSWSGSVKCIAEPGYYVLNNDRAVQLNNGRLILPVALHTADGAWSGRGRVSFYLSDNKGKSWRRNRQAMLEAPPASKSGLQEPGVIELKDGRLMVFCRTDQGSQYIAYSRDRGETWSTPGPSELASPVSPASIERIPSTGDLLAVWNDHSAVDPSLQGKRTPLTVAISRDEGKTWEKRKNLLADPDGWYCYTAIHFEGDRVLLAYNAGGAGLKRLSRTQIAVVPVSYLYS